jgi:hypothetical protein
MDEKMNKALPFGVENNEPITLWIGSELIAWYLENVNWWTSKEALSTTG